MSLVGGVCPHKLQDYHIVHIHLPPSLTFPPTIPPTEDFPRHLEHMLILEQGVAIHPRRQSQDRDRPIRALVFHRRQWDPLRFMVDRKIGNSGEGEERKRKRMCE